MADYQGNKYTQPKGKGQGGKHKHYGPIMHADQHNYADGHGKPDAHASEEYHEANKMHGMPHGTSHDSRYHGHDKHQEGGAAMDQNAEYT